MRVGLIARAEDRGLGNLTREWYRNMEPDRTLIVRPQAATDVGLAFHRAWYDDPDASTVHGWTGTLDEAPTKRWLDGLDVVYSAETFYDWRLCDWARELGVRTVCHAMPEYFKHAANAANRFPADIPGPDRWWNPTSWRQDYLPAGTEVVPVPVPLDRWPEPARLGDGPIRWLHVAGAGAHSDRNGTQIFVRAIRLLRGAHEVTIASQDHDHRNGKSARSVRVRHQPEVGDYWQLYEGHDALVLPRRYGGLCMPALEAMGAGLAVVMPDVEPQRSEWPIVPLDATFPNRITTSAGSIPICAVEPEEVARAMNHPRRLHDSQHAARGWAARHSWAAQRPAVVAALDRVLGG